MTATVNPAEIERFNRLAKTWWDPSGPMWPLHSLNNARVPFILSTLSAYSYSTKTSPSAFQELRVLDIGCGAGLLAEAMAKQGAAVTAVDPSRNNIDIAKAHARSSGVSIDYRCGTIDQLGSETFDVVLNMEVVEHVDNLPLFMQQCCALTAAGGMQFLATINRNPLSWLVAIVGAEYVLRWLPRGTHKWRKFVKPWEASEMLANGALKVVEERGVSVNPFTRSIRVSQFVGVNYMLAARKEG